ncbi:MAG: hypothetical protein PF541_07870, partial [Prolixibacteraceae bacterium]|nr:hypothetical protein [Prolixibacteraceae bacterium]
MKLLKIIFIVFLLFCVSNVFAYKPRRTNNFSSYKDKTQEFGYALNLSYLKYERSLSPQLHFHYSKYIQIPLLLSKKVVKFTQTLGPFESSYNKKI